MGESPIHAGASQNRFPEIRLKAFPYEMSGGMRQRVVGAISLACEPSILIADEPTTSLDVTIQAQYLKLLKDLQNQTHFSIIFITHDLGIVASV
jgi:ABC-type dipeptide/oligopeptide/nickel transport system ATPase component